MKEGDRVAVKGHHGLRGVIAAISKDGAACDVQFDHLEGPALYLLEELELLAADCKCAWCDPEGCLERMRAEGSHE